MKNMDLFSVIATAFAWFAASVAILLAITVVASVASLFGVQFGSVFRHGLWVLLLPIVLYAYGFFIERNLCRTRDIEIESPHVTAELDGYRIVHISDFHLKSFSGRTAAVKRIMKAIDNTKPDLVLFTGDLVTGSDNELAPFKTLLSGISARDGIYSVMGNHDYMNAHNSMSGSEQKAAEQRLREAESEMGWHILSDTCVNMPHGLSLAGVENISRSRYFQSRGNIAKAVSGINGQFSILMLHDPSVWSDSVAGVRPIDLTLSGHTHAAQMSVFGWSPASVVYKQARGLYTHKRDKKDGTQYLYVNPGLGETGLMARIGVPPEVTVILISS